MESPNQSSFLTMIPWEEWQEMKKNQQLILERLNQLTVPQQPANESISGYFTVKQFLAAVKIGRTKFQQLVANNEIRYVKKSRKIYIPVGEVERYFTDSRIS